MDRRPLDTTAIFASYGPVPAEKGSAAEKGPVPAENPLAEDDPSAKSGLAQAQNRQENQTVSA